MMVPNKFIKSNTSIIMLRKKINIHTLGSRINGGWGGGGHNQISRGGDRNKWDEGVANFDKIKRKGIFANISTTIIIIKLKTIQWIML